MSGMTCMIRMNRMTINEMTRMTEMTGMTCRIRMNSSVPARKFCLRAKVTPTTHFWGPDFSTKGQYLFNMQKRKNGWDVK